jgi:hypothetical protein
MRFKTEEQDPSNRLSSSDAGCEAMDASQIQPERLNTCYIQLKNNHSIYNLDNKVTFFKPKAVDTYQLNQLNGLYAYVIYEGQSNNGPTHSYLLIQPTVLENNRLESRHSALAFYTKPLIKKCFLNSVKPQIGGELCFHNGSLIWWNAQSTNYSLNTPFNYSNYLDSLNKNKIEEAYSSLLIISENIQKVLLPYEKFTLYAYDSKKPFISHELSSLTQMIHEPIEISSLMINEISSKEEKSSPVSVSQIDALEEMNTAGLRNRSNTLNRSSYFFKESGAKEESPITPSLKTQK